ncbi:DUF5681 domain-containing protein [Ahrensia marina]|uniref:DUF5681 domain-containing protein n=1 Tax=Ahrensia marina TaxID=1514904 RepID=A0A0N0E6H8_9HYPH|nr:DUF5681 domain-containing protein [Ahrensia marina]KPB00048.1 hypothetical protein SU32_15865 [Ahrensia marina]
MTDESNKKQPQPNDAINTDRIKQRTLLGDANGTDKQDVSHSTRFQKGQSGNPKGRPTKSKSSKASIGATNNKVIEISEHTYQLAIDQIILEFADKELTVKVGDQPIKMSGREALAQAQAKSALNGNAHAQKDIQNRIERAERIQLRKKVADAIFWHDYKTVMTAKLQTLADEGSAIDEEAFLPHPDDIEINEDLTIRFTGPTTPEALRKCHETMRFREAFILQAELDRRLAPKTDKTAGMGALLFAKNYERLLPARMRYSDSDWLNAVWRTEKINKRNLLKAVKSAWHDALRDKGGLLDTNVKRGLRFPGIKAAENFCADLHEFCHEATNSDRQITETDAEELCDIANEFGDQLKRVNKR